MTHSKEDYKVMESNWKKSVSTKDTAKALRRNEGASFKQSIIPDNLGKSFRKERSASSPAKRPTETRSKSKELKAPKRESEISPITAAYDGTFGFREDRMGAGD